MPSVLQCSFAVVKLNQLLTPTGDLWELHRLDYGHEGHHQHHHRWDSENKKIKRFHNERCTSPAKATHSPGGKLAFLWPLQTLTNGKWTLPHLSHLLGDIFLYQAVEGNNPADLQQHRGGGWLLASPAVAAAAAAGVASARCSARSCLVMAQVAPGRTAALLLAADLHAAHHVIREQLGLLQSWQVADEGKRLELAPGSSSPLICGLCTKSQKKQRRYRIKNRVPWTVQTTQYLRKQNTLSSFIHYWQWKQNQCEGGRPLSPLRPVIVVPRFFGAGGTWHWHNLDRKVMMMLTVSVGVKVRCESLVWEV